MKTTAQMHGAEVLQSRLPDDAQAARLLVFFRQQPLELQAVDLAALIRGRGTF